MRQPRVTCLRIGEVFFSSRRPLRLSAPVKVRLRLLLSEPPRAVLTHFFSASCREKAVRKGSTLTLRDERDRAAVSRKMACWELASVSGQAV